MKMKLMLKLLFYVGISPSGRPAYSAGPKQVTDLHHQGPSGNFFNQLRKEPDSLQMQSDRGPRVLSEQFEQYGFQRKDRIASGV